MAERYWVEVFSAEGLQGTIAVVFVLDALPSVEEMQAIAQKEAVPATCFVQQISPETFSIRFFNASNEIQLCGHGLLASAQVIAETGLIDFSFMTLKASVKAYYDEKDKRVWLAFDELKSQPAKMPDWIEECFDTAPEQVATAGSDDGYWIMEWPQDFELKNLAVDHTKLVQQTNRAVIATQKSRLEGYDYNFRYFAPQHGVIEDQATGSAHRVLVSYWSQKLPQCNFLARQLSKGGAELRGAIKNGDVWISGNIVIHQ